MTNRGLPPSHDINGEFSKGYRAVYRENGAITEVTILENRSDDTHERYFLRLESIQREGTGFYEENIGDTWEYSKSREGGGVYVASLSPLEDRFGEFEP